MQSRRDILRRFGYSTAGMLLPTGAAAANVFRDHSNEPPWWLFHPLSLGDEVGNGYKIKDLGKVKAGAAVLTLENTSSPLRVHVCLHDGQPKGIAYSNLFDLIVMDQGQGVRTVPPHLASALFALEDIMRENEGVDVPDRQLNGIKRMLTHSERVRLFGASNLR